MNLFVRNLKAIYLVIPFFFIGGVISGLNKQIRLYQKWKWEKENAIISFSYGYDKSPLKGVKTPKQSIKRQQPFFEYCGL